MRKQLLSILEAARGGYVSGEEVATNLGVSRSAVWKAVKTLRAEGHLIDSVTNKGYCLSHDSAVLTAEAIKAGMKHPQFFAITVEESLPSTNTALKSLASQYKAPERTVLIADTQTAGKGRLGRSFYSPPGSGLYLSLLLRESARALPPALITSGIAVSAAWAIEEVFGVSVDIKWVNDLFVNGKKVCGILTEASVDMESGQLDYAVAGIGINIAENDFPDELRSSAGALLDNPAEAGILRIKLASTLLDRLHDDLTSGYWKNGVHLEDYRKRMFLIGREVTVVSPTASYPATVLSVGDNAELVVRDGEGKIKVLHSGEVSLRGDFYEKK